MNQKITDIYPNNETTSLVHTAQQPKASSEVEDISIIMAVYNHEDTVADALDSALSQKMPYTYVIYCLDDASTDNSSTILNDYQKKYPDRVKVYTSPTNIGSGKQSFLFHKPPVKGKYWCLLAGDDYWTSPNKLAKQISFLEEHKDYVGCSCNTVIRNSKTREESTLKPDCDSWNILDLLLGWHNLYAHTTSLIWRNIYSSTDTFLPPAFKKSYARGDVMLTHMMLHRGGKIKNLPEAMSCYRVTHVGVWTKLSKQKQANANLELVKLLRRATPLKYRLLTFLHNKFPRRVIINKIFFGPVND